MTNHTHHYEYEIEQTGPDPSRDVEIIARCTQCEKALDADEIMALVNEAQWHYLPEMPEEDFYAMVAVAHNRLGKYVTVDQVIYGRLIQGTYAWRELPQPPERE